MSGRLLLLMFVTMLAISLSVTTVSATPLPSKLYLKDAPINMTWSGWGDTCGLFEDSLLSSTPGSVATTNVSNVCFLSQNYTGTVQSAWTLHLWLNSTNPSWELAVVNADDPISDYLDVQDTIIASPTQPTLYTVSVASMDSFGASPSTWTTWFVAFYLTGTLIYNAPAGQAGDSYIAAPPVCLGTTLGGQILFLLLPVLIGLGIVLVVVFTIQSGRSGGSRDGTSISGWILIIFGIIVISAIMSAVVIPLLSTAGTFGC